MYYTSYFAICYESRCQRKWLDSRVSFQLCIKTPPLNNKIFVKGKDIIEKVLDQLFPL